MTWTPLLPGTGGRLWYGPYAGKAVGDCDLDQFCNKPIEYDTVVAHTVPEYFPLIREREPGARLLGYTVWETTKIPKTWKPLLNSVDALMVPCNWNVDVFRQGGVTVPISVVPHTIRDSPLTEDLPFAVDPHLFVFYSINTWTARKACELTVRAYLDAFTADDPVVLIIKTSSDALTAPTGFFSRKILRKRYRGTREILDAIVAEYANPARILLVTDTLTTKQMARLHQLGNCYISLSRAEGWGLGAFDACAHGNPVIMTGFGGQLDFLDPSAAFLVPYTLIPAIDANPSYTPDQLWAEPDVKRATGFLRHVFLNQSDSAARGRALRSMVHKKFAPNAVIAAMRTAIAGGECPTACAGL